MVMSRKGIRLANICSDEDASIVVCIDGIFVFSNQIGVAYG